MKRFLPVLLILFYFVFGVFLLLQNSGHPETVSVIHQSSNHAIINVQDEKMAQEMIEALLNDKSRDPNAKTLIRIETGNPTKLHGILKGNGSIHVINANGIIVGADTVIELDDAPSYRSTIDSPNPDPILLNNTKNAAIPSDTVELEAHGNIYALKINKEGNIRATQAIESVSTLEPPKDPVKGKEEPQQ